jgi:cell division protein FtsL
MELDKVGVFEISWEVLSVMSRRRRYTRNEKIFYILSLLIIFSMVLSTIYIVITPTAPGVGF